MFRGTYVNVGAFVNSSERWIVNCIIIKELSAFNFSINVSQNNNHYLLWVMRDTRVLFSVFRQRHVTLFKNIISIRMPDYCLIGKCFSWYVCVSRLMLMRNVHLLPSHWSLWEERILSCQANEITSLFIK